MSNSLRSALLLLSLLALPACCNSSNKTYNTPMGPAGSPGTFALTSPAHNAGGVSTTAKFMWAAANGAATYRIQISTNFNFTVNAVDAAGLTNNQYTVPAAMLTAGTGHYWRVIATNATDDTYSTGAVATYSAFTTA